ncbi:ECF transporter S component [Aerococcaceae bacterium INB8]|uniref:ECF transporter S component n=1 Tax=Ruoffia halotolerans TaxID=2748684 RepID=A0A839A766_9LACT|nr:ECF transporter S component [Ruoffia halotolerans]MBA5729842.1 ECF transporter S component [Ruoffia halotolerans]
MFKTNNLVKIALLTALTTAISLLVIIPVPAMNGFVTLCEAGIYLGAVLLGPAGGFWVGALSGGLIDILSGAPQWALFSMIIHGIQGLLVGYLYQKFTSTFKLSISLVLGSASMIVGYFIATMILYTWPAAMASIPGNLVQTVFGSLVTIVVLKGLKKTSFNPAKGGN